MGFHMRERPQSDRTVTQRHLMTSRTRMQQRGMRVNEPPMAQHRQAPANADRKFPDFASLHPDYACRLTASHLSGCPLVGGRAGLARYRGKDQPRTSAPARSPKPTANPATSAASRGTPDAARRT